MLRRTDLNGEIRRVTINGRQVDLDVARNQLRFIIRGGSDTPPPPPPPPPPPADPPAPDDAAIAALQAEIDRAKTTGTNEATSTLLKMLGFDKIEDAEAFVKAKREEEKGKLSDVERREAEAAEKERKADERDAAAKTLIDTGIKREALRAVGCPEANLPDALKLIDITGDITEDSAKTAAEALKTKASAASLFVAATPPVPPPGPGNPPHPKPPAPSDPLEAGKARAEKFKKDHQGATKDDLLKDFAPPASPFVNV